MKMYEVGGAVRDELMGVNSKDVDFAVEASSFTTMTETLVDQGFKIFQSTPEFLTLRALVPTSNPLHKRTKVADFVLCRKDGAYKDGRRPETVEPGTILDDLARRDFTINAIAKDTETNELIDPYGGKADIEAAILRFVGSPLDRILEDGLRVLRGFRFMVTKGLTAELGTHQALHSLEAAEMLRKVSIERVREELDKMFLHDTVRSIDTMFTWSPFLLFAVFRDGLRLMPTMKAK
jgi:tRNA nucleotidyltransferase (CCA-adding enzyme)